MRRYVIATVTLGLALVSTGCKDDSNNNDGAFMDSDTASSSADAGSSDGALMDLPSDTTTTTTTGGDTTDTTDGGTTDTTDGGTTDTTTTTGGAGNCGDGVIDSNEQCDGMDLNGFTCTQLGYGGGTLACDPVTCTYDTSGCTPSGGTTATTGL